jgi:transcriptional regulator with XRE-family HTH domain
MSELVEKLQPEFQDEEYRRAYADDCLDTMIATQIRVLREQRGMTQGQLALATGMKQPRIPLLEDATYSNWSINTLKRFAKAFDVALSVKFETFSQLIHDFENLSRASLQRPAFADDTRFQNRRRITRRIGRRSRENRKRRFLRLAQSAFGRGSLSRANRYTLQKFNHIHQSPSNLVLARKLPRSAHHAGEGSKQQQQGAGGITKGLQVMAGGKLG